MILGHRRPRTAESYQLVSDFCSIDDIHKTFGLTASELIPSISASPVDVSAGSAATR